MNLNQNIVFSQLPRDLEEEVRRKQSGTLLKTPDRAKVFQRYDLMRDTLNLSEQDQIMLLHEIQ